MASNGKQFTALTREMLTTVARDQRWPYVVARISACSSNFAFVLFCYITDHKFTDAKFREILMSGSREISVSQRSQFFPQSQFFDLLRMCRI